MVILMKNTGIRKAALPYRELFYPSQTNCYLKYSGV